MYTYNTVIDGGWSDYSDCSATCGVGIKSRTCTNPRPDFGGVECEGDYTLSCNEVPCRKYLATSTVFVFQVLAVLTFNNLKLLK